MSTALAEAAMHVCGCLAGRTESEEWLTDGAVVGAVAGEEIGQQFSPLY